MDPEGSRLSILVPACMHRAKNYPGILYSARFEQNFICILYHDSYHIVSIHTGINISIVFIINAVSDSGIHF